MSDKTNYQEMRFDPHPTQRMVDACCARIAELGAENLRLTLAQPVYSRRQLQTRLEQAEAALAQRDRMLDCVQGMLREIRDASTVLGVRVGMQGALDNLADLRARAEE